MARGTLNQEVSCVVALSTRLYPSLLHRKVGATGTSSSTSGPAGCGIGAAAGQGVPKEVIVPGLILEVRRLWQPPSPTTASLCDSDTTPPSTSPYSATPSMTKRDAHRGQRAIVSSVAMVDNEAAAEADANDVGASLYAFVRVKEVDHRLSAWFHVNDVYVKRAAAQSAFGNSAEDSTVPSSTSDTVAVPYGLAPDMVRLSHVLHRPWLSSVYMEVTSGMARTQRAHRQLDYLEERLLRDCRTPTTVRYFVYLNTYVFAPWYYAPFGLLNSEYDPMLPWMGATDVSPSEIPAGEGANASGSSVDVQQQPFIRDAFLCPFSLRIYSTYAQMHYETRTYRAGRLRPPGEEVYRDEVRGFSLFKINGSQHVTYCRHLFLIGKSFLENKLAGHDVHNYYFYVLCLHHRYFPNYVSDPSAMYFAGFFTWEKHVSKYNLACIATLPCFGRRSMRQRPVALQDGSTAAALHPPRMLCHLGQFMIAASYELAYRRKQTGTPEKPLSDLGAVAYQHFWRRAIVRWMKDTLNAMRRAAAISVDEDDVEKTNRKDAQAGGQVAPRLSHTLGKDKPVGPDADSAVVEVVALSMEDKRASGEHDTDSCGSGEGKAALHEQRSKAPPPTRKRSRTDMKAEHVRDVDDDEEVRSSYSHGKLPLTSSTPLSSTKKGVLNLSAAAQSSASTSSAVGASAFTQRTTIKDIAAAVRLEEADVLRTLLGMGVLHRSSEDRGIQLLLPQRYVDWAYDEMLRWESSVEHAVFQSALLKSRGSHTSTR
ncbi:histone acetyltransferase, putative [Leishmania tarentolae]|uniref:Histone acetyltransferase, putative n=1 Tax=Leishmania tarentolae TaxID=5689 RepID=A0A640KKN1_LEITA|nr:histone acetyltransferase, putative [Leishmania tarentolae]